MIEYHGWITLCCSSDTWADDDWDAAKLAIEQEMKRCSVEGEQVFAFAETVNSMQTITLTGYADCDIQAVLGFMEFTSRILPESYGELVAFDSPWDSQKSGRFRLSSGRVERCGGNDF